MSKSSKRNQEPLIHITKRSHMPEGKAWGIRILAIVISLLVSSLVIILQTHYNPVQVFKAMVTGNFGSMTKIKSLFQNLAMLLCISLAVTPAFKMKFWNLGAEGQVLVGGLASAACMFYIKDSIPNALLIFIMLAASVAAGIVWGVIPAIFKAKWNANETLFTLMMNYVAIQLVSFCIMYWVPSGSAVMGVINMSSQAGWLPNLFGQKYLINILTVTVLTVFLYVYLKYSKQRYEITVVGESENTARYIGIDVKKVIIRTMVLSGAMCGLAGFLLVSGTNHTITKNTAGGMGFTAVMVSWLAKFNPAIMVLTSFLIVFLQKGAGEIATVCRLNESISDILTGIIIFFIIGSEFFINYKINFRSKHKEVK